MAELAVSAASPVVEVVVEKLASGLWKELGPARSVYTDMEKLRGKLSKIQDVLDDLERKPISSKALQSTLRQLGDAALDAEDAVEEFETESLRRSTERRDCMNTGKVRDFFSSNNPIAFRCRMAREIKEIRDRIDEIVKDNKDFDSMVRSAVSDSIIKKSESDRHGDRETSSLMVEQEIYGRVEDEKVVMDFLVDSDKEKNISILAIVGLGGVGKTTLAQLVYNNERIREQFELRMWVCVGENFDEKVILSAMIEQVTKEEKRFSTLQTMLTFLDEKLRAERFLLVLDDLWNDKESSWEKLKPLFMHAKLGSKIIVTTRIATVAYGASTIGSVSVHKLQELRDEDCWILFKQRAFRSEREEDNLELVEIGWEIVKKCGGLPLAAKALGSLINSRREKDEWLAIKNNEIWNLPKDEVRIVPILKLSYDHLPSHLKRCFTYCSMFPKDHRFEIKRLIQLWMAEGLIDTSGTSQNAEDIGRQYFNNLLSRSFFQDVQVDEYKNPLTCKMHDLVHDLACSISEDEALVMERDTKSISHGCRYLSVAYTYASSIDLKATYEAKKLRSLILVKARYPPIVDMDEFIFNVTKTFTRLRALDLSHGTIQKLSDRISRLKHLRFLDLSHTKISILPTLVTRLYNLQTLNLQQCRYLKELPEGISNLRYLRHIDISWCTLIRTLPPSITGLCSLQSLKLQECSKVQELPEGICNLCNLRYMDISWCTQITTLPTSVTRLSNLQTLKLKYCSNLRELPEGIGNLGNLRHLDITGCNSLSCIPRGLGQLSNLETLPMFIVTQENGCTIAELQHLNSICGRLEIKNLHHVKDPNEAMKANLSEKTRLNYLSLACNVGLQQERSSTEVEVATGVFERLQPHHNLRELAIYGYIGFRLPNWMSSSFPNLVKLTLQSLNRCEHLPSLGRLPSLKHLRMFKIQAVRRIAEEFYGDGDGNAFPLLEDFCLHHMPNLKEWQTEPTTAGRKMTAFPRLTKLSITACLILTVQPCIPCSVEDLSIKISNEILLSAGNLAGLSKLKKLNIWGCGVSSSSSSSGRWDGLQYLTALEELRIKYCQELTCLPEGIMYLPSLHTLELMAIRNLRSLEGGRRKHQQPTPFFTSLQTLSITEVDSLTALPEWIGGLSLLQILTINLEQLARLPDGLQHLTALKELHIYDCPQLAMLPDGLQQLTALQNLRINECPHLAMLPDGLQHLAALQNLEISGCPELAMLPDGLQHLSALQNLQISRCPLLAMLPDGLQYLTALQNLRISECPQLATLPDGLQYLSALQSLQISRCPQLERRCKRETGEDWHKISHIPQIYIIPSGPREL